MTELSVYTKIQNVIFFIQRSEIYSPSHDMHFENSSLSTEKIQLNPIGPVAPDKLKIPEATLWNVYPTCIISTIEVWVRLVDDDYNVSGLYLRMHLYLLYFFSLV